MPDFFQLIATLREQMTAELTRTDALRPLIWPIAGLLFAICVSVSAKAPVWLLIVFSVVLCTLLLAYIGGYAYFAVKDPDALRSEKYKLQKMAIEHGFLGDSLSGLKQMNDMPPVKTISVEPTKSLPND
jgi:energy-coupling factor transporter transmembrane protein EcfT